MKEVLSKKHQNGQDLEKGKKKSAPKAEPQPENLSPNDLANLRDTLTGAGYSTAESPAQAPAAATTKPKLTFNPQDFGLEDAPAPTETPVKPKAEKQPKSKKQPKAEVPSKTEPQPEAPAAPIEVATKPKSKKQSKAEVPPKAEPQPEKSAAPAMVSGFKEDLAPMLREAAAKVARKKPKAEVQPKAEPQSELPEFKGPSSQLPARTQTIQSQILGFTGNQLPKAPKNSEPVAPWSGKDAKQMAGVDSFDNPNAPIFIPNNMDRQLSPEKFNEWKKTFLDKIMNHPKISASDKQRVVAHFNQIYGKKQSPSTPVQTAPINQEASAPKSNFKSKFKDFLKKLKSKPKVDQVDESRRKFLGLGTKKSMPLQKATKEELDADLANLLGALGSPEETTSPVSSPRQSAPAQSAPKTATSNKTPKAAASVKPPEMKWKKTDDEGINRAHPMNIQVLFHEKAARTAGGGNPVAQYNGVIKRSAPTLLDFVNKHPQYTAGVINELQEFSGRTLRGQTEEHPVITQLKQVLQDQQAQGIKQEPLENFGSAYVSQFNSIKPQLEEQDKATNLAAGRSLEPTKVNQFLYHPSHSSGAEAKAKATIAKKMFFESLGVNPELSHTTKEQAKVAENLLGISGAEGEPSEITNTETVRAKEQPKFQEGGRTLNLYSRQYTPYQNRTGVGQSQMGGKAFYNLNRLGQVHGHLNEPSIEQFHRDFLHINQSRKDLSNKLNEAIGEDNISDFVITSDGKMQDQTAEPTTPTPETKKSLMKSQHIDLKRLEKARKKKPEGEPSKQPKPRSTRFDEASLISGDQNTLINTNASDEENHSRLTQIMKETAGKKDYNQLITQSKAAHDWFENRLENLWLENSINPSPEKEAEIESVSNIKNYWQKAFSYVQQKINQIKEQQQKDIHKWGSTEDYVKNVYKKLHNILYGNDRNDTPVSTEDLLNAINDPSTAENHQEAFNAITGYAHNHANNLGLDSNPEAKKRELQLAQHFKNISDKLYGKLGANYLDEQRANVGERLDAKEKVLENPINEPGLAVPMVDAKPADQFEQIETKRKLDPAVARKYARTVDPQVQADPKEIAEQNEQKRLDLFHAWAGKVHSDAENNSDLHRKAAEQKYRQIYGDTPKTPYDNIVLDSLINQEKKAEIEGNLKKIRSPEFLQSLYEQPEFASFKPQEIQTESQPPSMPSEQQLQQVGQKFADKASGGMVGAQRRSDIQSALERPSKKGEPDPFEELVNQNFEKENANRTSRGLPPLERHEHMKHFKEMQTMMNNPFDLSEETDLEAESAGAMNLKQLRNIYGISQDDYSDDEIQKRISMPDLLSLHNLNQAGFEAEKENHAKQNELRQKQGKPPLPFTAKMPNIIKDLFAGTTKDFNEKPFETPAHRIPSKRAADKTGQLQQKFTEEQRDIYGGNVMQYDRPPTPDKKVFVPASKWMTWNHEINHPRLGPISRGPRPKDVIESRDEDGKFRGVWVNADDIKAESIAMRSTPKDMAQLFPADLDLADEGQVQQFADKKSEEFRNPATNPKAQKKHLENLVNKRNQQAKAKVSRPDFSESPSEIPPAQEDLPSTSANYKKTSFTVPSKGVSGKIPKDMYAGLSDKLIEQYHNDPETWTPILQEIGMSKKSPNSNMKPEVPNVEEWAATQAAKNKETNKSMQKSVEAAKNPAFLKKPKQGTVAMPPQEDDVVGDYSEHMEEQKTVNSKPFNKQGFGSIEKLKTIMKKRKGK